MKQDYRGNLIRLFTFLGGIYFFLEFLLPKNIGTFEFGYYHEEITNGFIAIGAMAFGLGLINIFSVHGGRIIFRRKGAIQSVALLVGLLTMIYLASSSWLMTRTASKEGAAFTNLALFATRIKTDAAAQVPTELNISQRSLLLIDTYNKERDAVRFHVTDTDELANGFVKADQSIGILRSAAKSTDRTSNLTALDGVSQDLSVLGNIIVTHAMKSMESSVTKRSFTLLQNGLFTALGSAMFSLLGFFIVSAAYRAFRVRTVEAGIMMVAAVIVMLGQIPFGVAVSEELPHIRLWLLQIPNTAAFRAITFGAAVAGLILSIRMWLSIESGHFDDHKKKSGDAHGS
jgi:hypothetical protein